MSLRGRQKAVCMADLYGFFLDHLDFKLHRIGVDQKDLPYRENWVSFPDTMFSQIRHAKSVISFKDRPAMQLQPGEACIIPTRMLARSECLRDRTQRVAVFHWMHFQFLLFQSVDISNYFAMPCVLPASQAQYLGDLVAQMAGVHHADKPMPLHAAATVRSKAQAFMCQVFKLVPLRLDLAKLTQHDWLAIRPALEYIATHYQSPVTVEALARQVSLSPSRFHAVFKSVMGQPPMDYLIDTRIKHSQQLLLLNDLSIKQVAMQSGYIDQLAFSKAFKMRMGISPTQYRELAQR